jgi:hypothetical protein
VSGRQGNEVALDGVGVIAQSYGDAAGAGRPLNGFQLAAGAALAVGAEEGAAPTGLEPAEPADPTSIRPRHPGLVPYWAVHPIPLAAAATPGGGAGTIDPTSLLAPRTGFAWDIRRITVIFGTGCTQVNVVYNAVDASTTIAQLFASGNINGNTEIMTPGERLVFQSIGGPATISGKAIEIALPWLASYLL